MLRFVLSASVLALASLAPAEADFTTAALAADTAPEGAVWLDSLDLSKAAQGWGEPMTALSIDRNPLTLQGQAYRHGFGTHARGELWINLKGAATRFVSVVGVDDEVATKGRAMFEVWVDGRLRARTAPMRGLGPPARVDVDLAGARSMKLVAAMVDRSIDFAHADWAGAAIVLKPGETRRPETVAVPMHVPKVAALADGPEPALHGPLVVGATPGRAFLFQVPATGARPLAYSATGLPEGLQIDRKTGIISGSVKSTGTVEAKLTVRNSRGRANRGLRIVAGAHMLALTPPLGWNSWNVWGTHVDAAKVRAAADAMADSPLARHGYQYIVIDDGWAVGRDAAGEMQTTSSFGDMKALADYVHSKGLKLGIYSSPGPTTCAGFEGSHKHEQQDAITFARWGIDYLKYDWCSYGRIVPKPRGEDYRRPYRVMRSALDAAPRDIVYSLCQYGMDDVWKWGAEVGGNLWRSTGDITDSWASLEDIAFRQPAIAQYAGPGHWNDPDMLVVGKLGWSAKPRPTRLTPAEQVTHITAWSLCAAPLMIGCDMAQMDTFTLALLCNDEVLAVNQDPLGKAARCVGKDGAVEVWARPLADGTVAVGLFNRDLESHTVEASWSSLGIKGRQPIRDLWQRKGLGSSDTGFYERVGGHGAVMLRVGKPAPVRFPRYGRGGASAP